MEKRAGDQIFAGTLSEVGALEVRVTKIGKETTLGQTRTLTEEAQTQGGAET
ncbi:MAG: hypothetical protein ACE14P_01805 [Methanotrichaceae archaeon]